MNSTAHKYLAVGEKTRFLVVSAAAGVISIDGGDVPGGSNLYVIYPFTPSLRSGSTSAANQQMISIDHFHVSRDVIDLSLLRQFQKISDISYSTNPLILVLSDYQVILFPSISEMVLDESNFILSRPSEEELNSLLSVLDGSVYVALGIFLIMSLTALVCSCVHAEKERKASDSLLERFQDIYVDEPEEGEELSKRQTNHLFSEGNVQESIINISQPDLPAVPSSPIQRDLRISSVPLSSISFVQQEISSVRSTSAARDVFSHFSKSHASSDDFSSVAASSSSSSSSSFASTASSLDFSSNEDDDSFASL